MKKIKMDCPLCGKHHEVVEGFRKANAYIKGEDVEYMAHFYICTDSPKEENEFVTPKMITENLLNVRNEYRKKHNLITSEEIVAIRKKYGLTQIELANLLDWGAVTIARYESKAIQEEAYDNVLRLIRENPKVAYDFLEKNQKKFSEERFIAIKKRITDCIEEYGKEYIQRQALESQYVEFIEPSEENGYSKLNIDKIEAIINYYAERVKELMRVKLMKMLWYADALSYKESGRSMTGLVYIHMTYGALPRGYYAIMALENVKCEETMSGEYLGYRFLPNEKVDMSCLSEQEVGILNRVIDKFSGFTSQRIIDYMHQEDAYKNTEDGEVISYELAKRVELNLG